jgi:hypothetical protein
MTDGEVCTVDRPAYDVGRGDRIWWEGEVRHVYRVVRDDEVTGTVTLYTEELPHPVVAINDIVEVVV